MTLTPLRLVLIILVVGSLCFLFKDMVEADSSRSSISSRCQSIIDKIKNTCSNKSYKDCKKCIRAKSHTACHDQDDNVVNPIIQGLCQKQHPKTPSSPPSGPSPKTPPSGPKTCQTWFNKNNKCPKGLKKPDKTQCKNGNCNKQTCCKRKQSPPPPPKTCGEWLNDNKSKCKGNSINFEKIPCSDNNCNESICCGGDPDKEYDYCTKYVTEKDSNEYEYCMKKYPKDMFKHSTAVTPDQCDSIPWIYDQSTLKYLYCEYNPNATPKECKDLMWFYCENNPNANKDQCKDMMDLFCDNPISKYKACKKDEYLLDLYCQTSQNATAKQCNQNMDDYCQNPNVNDTNMQNLNCNNNCNDWLKNNTCSDKYIPAHDRTDCHTESACNDKDCCLKDKPHSDDISTYCLDEVTEKSGEESLQYCLNNLPDTCGLNRYISFDTCKKAKEQHKWGDDDLGLNYCESRYDAGKYCTSGDHRISYCFRNPNAQLENCKDNETIMISRRYNTYDISGLTAKKGYCFNPNIPLGPDDSTRNKYCSR